jgi:bacillithiol biosynthesis cysteine-adding enzyme BshC
VLPDSGVSAPASPTAILPVDIRRFPWIARLAGDYAFDYPALDRFYSGNPADSAAWQGAIARAREHPRDRVALVDLLLQQQLARGAPPEALAATRELRDPQTVAVVTGQQASLFGGPLFTLLKALTALRLAEHVRTAHRAPAVAVFWIDAEDHDWNEVGSCGLLDADLQPRVVSLGEPPGAHVTSIARVRLDESVTSAIAELERLLPGTEFTAGLLDTLRHVYRPGTGMAEAFGRLLESLLGPHGLIVFDSADAAAKPLVAGLFVRELERPGQTSRLAAEAGAALQEGGYHAQVSSAAGSVALFHLDGGREPVRLQADDTFLVGDRPVSGAELRDRARATPAAFSPNVLLRPLVQDTLFPTACYVPGPSELAYLGQLKRVYEAYGIPMPLMHQRVTATIVDSNALRFLTRHDFPLERLRAQDEAALNDLLQAQLPADVEASFAQAVRGVDDRMQALMGSVGAVDPTLEGAARSTLSRMQDELKRLHGKIIQAEKRKHDTLRRQFRHAQAQAFPAGEPQERQIGFVYFLNKYGPALIDRVSEVLPGRMGMHYVVTI